MSQKIGICTPWSSPFVWKKFTQNMADMLCQFRRPGWEVRFFCGRGVDPAARHVDMCLQGLKWGADLILIIGADQIHPADMIDRLIDRFEQVDGVITALVPFRGYVSWQDMKPFQPMGWHLRCDGVREFRGYREDPDMLVPIDPKAGDLQEIDIIGSGVLLMHREHLTALKPPWFYYRVDPRTMQRVADMDTRFVYRLRTEAGAQVWCDTTIKVKHIHDMEIDDSFQHRFDDWMDGNGDASIVKYYRLEEQIIGS